MSFDPGDIEQIAHHIFELIGIVQGQCQLIAVGANPPALIF